MLYARGRGGGTHREGSYEESKAKPRDGDHGAAAQPQGLQDFPHVAPQQPAQQQGFHKPPRGLRAACHGLHTEQRKQEKNVLGKQEKGQIQW